MWTQAKSPLGYRCQDCDTDLPVTGADHDLSVLTCPECGSAVENAASRNVKARRELVRAGSRDAKSSFQ